jgi:hypothetical protein
MKIFNGGEQWATCCGKLHSQGFFTRPASSGKPVLYLPLLAYIILTAGVLALLLNDHPLMLTFQRAWFSTIYSDLNIEKNKKLLLFKEIR